MSHALQDITETTGLFYYMTMKNFERQIQQKSNKKYRKMDSLEKRLLHEQIKEKMTDIFSFEKMRSSICYKSLQINNYEDLFRYFSQADLFAFIKGVDSLDRFFPCGLIDGHYAWISKSNTGHFRYFSKGKDSPTIGFDLIDLLEIYYGTSTSLTIQNAVSDFQIKFMEDVWMDSQNKKYLENLTFIHGAKNRIQGAYPFLYDYIVGHIKVLETINVIANINIKNQAYSYHGQNIFFASNSYIANFLGNYTLSTTNKVINLFAVLGLIKKLPEKDIPSELLKESKTIADERSLGNIISYYIIPPMSEVLEYANDQAKILYENNVKYSNISKAKIAFVFGDAFAQSIYVQEVQKNKKKKAEVSPILHKKLEKTLNEILCDKGYVTKKMVAKKYIPKTSLGEREKELDKIWKSLLVRFNLSYVKPTNALKERFGLTNSEYIAVKKSS
ncbi:hypothetical protein PP175_28160 (plasmid) [Aneurinibacillus sp. Ricciae_BoGa-3]|uniref:hypothetical protein n=1 Tax=Aneurinibacillus sp. Ricciae_BoGa-3 TaxID=3022697 RepID=UPI002341A0AB|nr:hypothetical protein [Aneurinibacillus sp. Ricciae_BoGa-3]WCK57065.1 hypothetical protein PP175_28160 [Aneurinibacillus sp. Ricciae_BoGa-3]